MPAGPHPITKHALLFAAVALAIAGVGVALEYPVAGAVFEGNSVFLSGPDDYMRVYRARQIASGEAHRLRYMPEINSPIGAQLHWTAPMDYLIAGAGTIFGGLASGQSDAFAAVAACVPVALGACYVLCMIGFMRRGFGPWPALLVGAVVVLSPAFHRVFRLGHADHHCLVNVLLLIALGGWIPRAEQDGTPGRPTTLGAALSGLAMGLALWVAASAVYFWAALLAGISYACLTGSQAARQHYAEKRFAWNCATAAVVAVCFLLENWPDLNAFAVDKISLLHLALVALAFLVPSRPAAGPLQPGRIVVFAVGLVGFTAWLLLDRSRAFEYVSGDDFFRWSASIAELQPLFTRTTSDWSLAPMHVWLGYVPYAFTVLWLFFLMSRAVPRPVKGALGIVGPIVLLLAILQRRWLDHVNLAVTPVAVLGAYELARVLATRFSAKPHVVLQVSATTAILITVLLPGTIHILSRRTQAEITANEYQRRTHFVAQRILAYEAAHPSQHSNRRAILSEEGEGPALLYWTGLPVVAAPYHRALDGVMQASRFFAERDPAAARRQLDSLGVRYIVMPPRAHEQLMQFEQMVFGELRSFSPPDDILDAAGNLLRKINYRREAALTMAYRLVIESHTQVIPSIELIAKIDEGATTPDGKPLLTGLLYVVQDLPSPPTPAADRPSD
jgi:hypothetical protein